MSNPFPDYLYLSPPHMSGREQRYVQEAFQENWITTAGPNVDGFEKELATYLNMPGAAALSSGTAALHLALLTLNIGPGDEVFCSTFTFAASANPILYVGATPVFIDSEPGTWNMCPALLEEALQDRQKQGKLPKAIILVHLYGMPSRMREIQEVALKYDIPIIEDAAEALGSKYQGQQMGTFGALGIFSFNGNKIITTSGGGALVAYDTVLVERAKWLAMQAKEPFPFYHHTTLGFNYRLSNICAGIGRGQLEVLDLRVKQRRDIFAYYKELLKEVEELEWQEEPEGFFSNRWLSCLLVKESSSVTASDIRLQLQAGNIESRPLWQPMHRQPLYQDCMAYGGSVSDDLFDRGLCLPSGSSLTTADQERVADIIRQAFN